MIAGTPKEAGTFEIQITAMDQNRCTGTATFTILIDPPWLYANGRAEWEDGETRVIVRPERYRNEVLGFLRDPLQDLSISRPRTRWRYASSSCAATSRSRCSTASIT